MADTVRITLAKALKLKNRLAGRITKLTQDVQVYNSVQDGTERPDVPAALAERRELVARLVELKAAITDANRPVQAAIYELAERKGEAALYAGLNTKHGTYAEGYPTGGPVTYVAAVRKAEADREGNRAQKAVDQIQDRLDAFNTETVLAVDPAVLTLADGE